MYLQRKHALKNLERTSILSKKCLQAPLGKSTQSYRQQLANDSLKYQHHKIIFRYKHNARHNASQIKAQIQKPITEQPSSYGYRGLDKRSFSSIIEKQKQPTDNKRDNILLNIIKPFPRRAAKHKQDRYRLPPLSSQKQLSPTKNLQISARQMKIQQNFDDQVITMHRNMRHRLSRIPKNTCFDQANTNQPDHTLSGWHRQQPRNLISQQQN